MKAKPNEDLQKEIVEMFSRVEKHGYYYAVNCCFHNDSHPSMFIYPDGFQCKGCDKYGSLEYLYKYLRKSDAVSYVDTTKQSAIPPWRTWLSTYGTWEDFCVEAYKKAKAMPVLLNYIRKQRKLGDMIEPAKIGWMDGWITFPVFDREDNVVDVTVRATPAKQTEIRYAIRPRELNEGTPLYAHWKAVDESRVVYVVYGILDRLSLSQINVPAITGISGKTINHTLFDGMRKQFRIIPDWQEEQAASRLVEHLGWRGRQVKIDWPDGCKDINDVLVRFGPDKVKELIQF